MFRVAVLFITLLGLLAPTAHAERKSDNRVASTVARSDIPQRGTLYRIERAGHTAWLFGTVHIGQSAFYPLEPKVMRAFRQADALVIEADIRDQANLQKAVTRYAVYPEHDSIDHHLTPTQWQALQDALAKAGLPAAQIQRLKPWMVANLLMLQAMTQAGYPSEQGIEQYFLDLAHKENKQVRALETVGYQLSLFDRLTPAQQADYLQETLEDLQANQGIEKGIQLIEAWKTADHAKMVALKQAMLAENTTTSSFIDNVLLKERNPGMANGIIALLEKRERIFVAIGALHLLGDDGVPALLRTRGYRVTRIY
ncbi:TraB/GumN family protein [uncultured Oxalicibacterium sp.]|uniref:TraB/GumN family protein n=1 Tax=uncultured Oxalicibacterium sp. TaxID=1168540 RepID=UPI0025D3BA30|nr:TraB/GumN family protein [uncultured Oxalicibacterium sp.]